MSYDTFRQFADSWGLIYMVAIFFGVVVYLLRPSAKHEAIDAAQIPFNEDR